LRHLRLVFVLAVVSALAWTAFAGVESNNPSAPDPTASAAQPAMKEADFSLSPTPEDEEPAPDFQYLAIDGHWKFLHDLRTKGNVLIVFEPTDAQLTKLQAERDSLFRAGVQPVAILRRPESACWGAIERLHLTYSVMSDPRGDLGRDFRVTVRDRERTAPSWFLVDRAGNVRGMERGRLPAGSFAGVVRTVMAPPATAGSVPDARP